jgi:hypothetical protein
MRLMHWLGPTIPELGGLLDAGGKRHRFAVPRRRVGERMSD